MVGLTTPLPQGGWNLQNAERDFCLFRSAVIFIVTKVIDSCLVLFLNFDQRFNKVHGIVKGSILQDLARHGPITVKKLGSMFRVTGSCLIVGNTQLICLYHSP